jgi:hypothetical protein
MMEGPGKPPQMNLTPTERSSLEFESQARELYLRCKTVAERRVTPVTIEDAGKPLYRIKMIGAKGPNPIIELTLGKAYNTVFTIDSLGRVKKKEQPNSGASDPSHSVMLRKEEIRDILRELNELRLGDIVEEGEALINNELPPQAGFQENKKKEEQN